MSSAGNARSAGECTPGNFAGVAGNAPAVPIQRAAIKSPQEGGKS